MVDETEDTFTGPPQKEVVISPASVCVEGWGVTYRSKVMTG